MSILTLIFRLLLTATLLFGAFVMSFTLNAQQLNRYTALKVQQATVLQQQDKLEQAITILTEHKPSSKYDQAFVGRVLGVYLWRDNKPNEAIIALENAISLHALSVESQWKTQRMLADILFSEQQYKRSIGHYQQLTASSFESKGKDKNAKQQQKNNEIFLRIATANYQLQRWTETLSTLNKYQPADRNDQLQVLKLTVVAQLNVKHWQSAERTLAMLINMEPNEPNWWRQQVAVQFQLKRSSEALITYSLAKQQGVAFRVSDYKALSQLYAQQKMPERAARISDEMMQAFPTTRTEQQLIYLATYWQQAKEWNRAIKVWTELNSINAKHSWPLAKLQLQQGNYQSSLNTLTSAKTYADPQQFALVHIRVLYKLHQYEKALLAAKRFNEQFPSESAKSWVTYLQNKQHLLNTSFKSEL
ncbi:tetratricopeptide repeat protein [Aliivibrio kagoshimensis]|uniref:tetratricopeptide repeat protein n=1 Tax=Aliivibrio kagoshimensis TaxID=2910230 RepID=UPI003D11D57E